MILGDENGKKVDPNPYWPLVVGTNGSIKPMRTRRGTEKITVSVTDEIKEIEYPEGFGPNIPVQSSNGHW